jgi:hypothetical protein
MKILTLDRLIEEELFIVKRLISADEFVSFCKDRGIRTSRDNLELYEKLGILYPLARVEFPKYKEKIERSPDGSSYRMLGSIQEDEVWSGETEEMYGHFWWKKDIANDFRKEGLLWSPDKKPFSSWSNYYDSELHAKKIESYYSEFQILPLYIVEQATMKVSLAWWHTYDEKAIAKLTNQIKHVSNQYVNSLTSSNMISHEIADICQAISNRYFPKTQTDRRTINISHSGEYWDWNWYQYRYEWKAKTELENLDIDADKIKKYQEAMSHHAHSVDPLSDWYDLIQFVSLDRKKRLKNEALLAQTFYSMEMMLRFFYKDLTGEELSEYRGVDPDWKDHYYGKNVTDSNMMFLEYLTNEYHLNPRPLLILLVEGKSEYNQMPRLAREIGYRLDCHGVRIELLEGVGNFTNGKIERFIDHYHNLQTIVYLILDNENNAGHFKNKILKKRSRYEANRLITKENYICLWDKSFEFDNFTDEEIAKALSSILPEVTFDPNLIAECRIDFGKQKDPLSQVFKQKTGKELNKPLLAERLVDPVVAHLKKEYSGGKPHRKLLLKIEEIINLAVKNHQPHSLKNWKENQESGYLGEKCE